MKKLILAGLLSLTLCSGVFAADNGAILTKEEGQAHALITALADNNYDSAKSAMSKDLASKVTPEVFAQMQKQIKDKFGSQKEMKLAVMEKFDQLDRLTYVAAYGDNKIVRIVIAFGPDGRGGIQNFSFSPLKVNQGTEKK